MKRFDSFLQHILASYSILNWLVFDLYFHNIRNGFTRGDYSFLHQSEFIKTPLAELKCTRLLDDCLGDCSQGQEEVRLAD